MSNEHQPDLIGDPLRFVDPAAGDRRTLDQHIAACIALRDANPGSGDWPVQKYMAGARQHAGAVHVAHIKVKLISNVGRAVALPAFWQAGFDDEASKGPPVVRVT